VVLQANGFFDKAVGIHSCADGFDNGALAINRKA
jgi:hypothetical protein